MTRSPSIAWVHISDIHFGHGKSGAERIDQKIVASRLIEDAKRLSKRVCGSSRKPDMILFTGDLLWSGNAEYASAWDKARDWLATLGKGLKVPPERVFLVPGNHDLNRKWVEEDDPTAKAVHKDVHSNPLKIDDYIETASVLKASIWPKFGPYCEFLGSASPCRITAEKPYWTDTLKTGLGVITLIGLNSCFCSWSDKDAPETLALGKKQINDSIRSVGGHDFLLMVLQHHPPKWLADGGNERNALTSEPHILCCGHIHKDEVEVLASHGKGSVFQIVAGVAHDRPGKKDKFSYHWVRLGAEGVRFWPRFWSDEDDKFCPDSAFNLDASKSRLVKPTNLPPPLQDWIANSTGSKKKVRSGRKRKPRTGAPHRPSSYECGGCRKKIETIIGEMAEGLTLNCFADKDEQDSGCELPSGYLRLVAELLRNTAVMSETSMLLYRFRLVHHVVQNIVTSFDSGDFELVRTDIRQLESTMTLLSSFLSKLDRDYSQHPDGDWECPYKRLSGILQHRAGRSTLVDVTEFSDSVKLIWDRSSDYIRLSPKAIDTKLAKDKELRIAFRRVCDDFKFIEDTLSRGHLARYQTTGEHVISCLVQRALGELPTTLKHTIQNLPHATGRLPRIWAEEILE